MSDTKKIYVQPSVELLGSIAEKTEAGRAPSADATDGLNNTAFAPGS